MEHIWVTDGLIVRKTHVYLAYYPVIYFNNNLSTFTPNTLAVILIGCDSHFCESNGKSSYWFKYFWIASITLSISFHAEIILHSASLSGFLNYTWFILLRNQGHLLTVNFVLSLLFIPNNWAPLCLNYSFVLSNSALAFHSVYLSHTWVYKSPSNMLDFTLLNAN